MTSQPPSGCGSLVGLLAALAVAAGLTAPIAQAGPDYQFFQSPTGNISCILGTFSDHGTNRATAACQIDHYDYPVPPRPANCMGGWGDSVGLIQGSAASLQCHTDTMLGSVQPTLAYGQTRTSGSIRCNSEPSGITCTDSTTGHGFSLSRNGYQTS